VTKKAWGGRFEGGTDLLMERFSSSIAMDWVLYPYDIEGSVAFALMLARIGVLTDEEKDRIVKGLSEIRDEIAQGLMPFADELEDIHMHIEARLIEKVGDLGKKLHTGRSRNDQVAVDMRLFLKDKLREIRDELVWLMRAILDRAESFQDYLMPGYTHTQRAQVVTMGHHLLAYYYMFKRDRKRLQEAFNRTDVMPLGSGALAGSTIPLDREFLRERLGFSRLSENSMDAVSDRDFVVDSLYSLSMIMMHLSRVCEDLILFSTTEFGFISLPDPLCTGSSLMPHKKNPDALELTRGKSARVFSDLFSLLVLLKGLPLTYNRDMQEDKEPLFHGLATVKDALGIVRLTVEGFTPLRDKMEEAVRNSPMQAVEMAEYLALKGVPFREAHHIVGTMVKDCERAGRRLSDMTITEVRQYSEAFDEDVQDYVKPENVISRRKTLGGASLQEVRDQIAKEKDYLHS
jgi:argininosuccinate lyase